MAKHHLHIGLFTFLGLGCILLVACQQSHPTRNSTYLLSPTGPIATVENTPIPSATFQRVATSTSELLSPTGPIATVESTPIPSPTFQRVATKTPEATKTTTPSLTMEKTLTSTLTPTVDWRKYLHPTKTPVLNPKIEREPPILFYFAGGNVLCKAIYGQESVVVADFSSMGDFVRDAIWIDGRIAILGPQEVILFDPANGVSETLVDLKNSIRQGQLLYDFSKQLVDLPGRD